ncbi:MAG: HAD-IC family P-type ATPase [Eubacteriaceae bacterium]|nr:HAD-IC family P-type ATPase [Eubacteriaceae bacterium]
MENNELQGLDSTQVSQRMSQGQVNTAPQETSRSYKEIFKANVFTFFNGILGSLLLIVLLAGSFHDALFGFVLIFNSLIGIIQEVRAKLTLDRLSLIVAPKAHVIRETLLQEISTDLVVLDDVVQISAGDQVVTDGILLFSEGLEIDESLLTGESVPIIKKTGDELLSGSFAVAGSGKFRVTKVGADSYAHKLASEARRFNLARSELHNGINTILKWVTWFIIPAGLLLYYSQLRADLPIRPAAVGAIAGMVGMIPQGLVLLTSMTFALSVISLGQQKVLVQQLPAVEALARVDVLCLDKTGTLTEGKLVLDQLVKLEQEAGSELALGAIGEATTLPNTTLAAIAAAYPNTGAWEAVDTIPFSSSRKWSAANFGQNGCWYLGAPEMLLADSAPDEALTLQITSLTEAGFRVLLLASSPVWTGSETLPVLRPAALILFNEKVRSDVSAAMKYFKEEGVAIKIISGDNPSTVASVAKRAGITDVGKPFDGRFLPEDLEALADVMTDHTVFGRVTPQDKQKMIKALHLRGHVVAMTGDGVNDVLALKDADLGIAMGSGVAAARHIAQIVLLDGKFSTLPVIVAEGRRVISNIERVANLFLTKTVYALLISIAIVVMGWPFPFLPRHLTLTGDLTIGIPAFFLALAPNLRRYQPGFINRVLHFTVPVGFLTACSTFTAYAYAMGSPEVTLEQSRTVAAFVLLFISLWIVVILARPLTVLRSSLIFAIVITLGIITVTPFLRSFFALSFPPWPVLILPGILVVISIILLEVMGRVKSLRFP